MGKARNLARLVVDSGGAVDAGNLTNAVPADGSITSAKIADGAVGTADIADSAVTTAKIAAGAVATVDIAANAVTVAKMAREGSSGQVLTSNGAGSDPSYQTISTTPTTAQVLSATAGAAVGDVGTYAWLWSTTTTATSVGATKAGSNLRYAGLKSSSGGTTSSTGSVNMTGNGGTPAGTWRAMGRDASAAGYGITDHGMTLWLRIS